MKAKPDIQAKNNLIGYCGLYCAACPRFLKGKCTGCNENKASWCKVKPCNEEHSYTSCADCDQLEDISKCKKFNPLMIRIGEFMTRTSRKACIDYIKEEGRDAFVDHMVTHRLVSMKKTQ